MCGAMCGAGKEQGRRVRPPSQPNNAIDRGLSGPKLATPIRVPPARPSYFNGPTAQWASSMAKWLKLPKGSAIVAVAAKRKLHLSCGAEAIGAHRERVATRALRDNRISPSCIK